MSHARRSAGLPAATVSAVVTLCLVTPMGPTSAEPVSMPVSQTQHSAAVDPGADDIRRTGSFIYVPRVRVVHDDDVTVRETVRLVGKEVVPVTVTTVAVNSTRAQTVQVTAPYRVALRAGFTLSGKVPVRNGARTRRLVVVQQWVNSRWRTIGRTQARLTGTFRTRMHASSRPMLAKVRARVSRSAGRPAAVSRTRTIGFGSAAQVQRLRIVNTAADWTWMSPTHDRWGKCRLTWAYVPAGGYAGAESHARRAIAAVDAQASYTLAQVAPTATPDITIRWSTPQQNPRLRGGTLGVAELYASGRSTLVAANVVLDRTEAEVGTTFDFRPMTWGSVLMHELTHSMGLGHAHGLKQVMYPLSTSGVWGRGDRAGLARVSNRC